MRTVLAIATAVALATAGCGGGSDTAVEAAAAPRPVAQAQASQSADTFTAALRVYQALYGRAPTTAEFAALSTPNTLALATSLAANFSSMSDTAFATAVLANMGVNSTRVSATSLTILQTALTQFFNAYGSSARGIIVNNLVSLLGNLESDGTWGTAARAFNTTITTARTAVDASVVSVPLQSALQGFVDRSSSYTVTVSGSGTSNGTAFTVTGSGTASDSAPATVTFEGQANAKRKARTIAATLTSGGQTQADSATGLTYFSSAYVPVGESSDSAYCVMTSSSPLPDRAKAGDSGTWYTETCYSSSTKQTVTSTGSGRYTVEAASATGLTLRVIATASSSATATATTTDTYAVTTAGVLTWRSRVLAVNASGTNGSLSTTVTYTVQ